MSEPKKAPFQFSLSDVLVGLLCLAAPTAWLASLDFSYHDDRDQAFVAMMLSWIISFILAISYRRAWNSVSSWFLPPFLFAGWSLALLPWALSIWWPIALFIAFTPAVFLGVTAYLYERKKNSWIGASAWAFIAAFGGLVGSAIFSPSMVTPRWATNQMSAAAFAKAMCEAQEIYHRTDYDKDGVLEYAQSGWDMYETKTGAADLQLIQLIEAQSDATNGPPKLMKAGYHFKILKGQGSQLGGEAKNYVDANGNMTGGHAVVVYPAEYRKLGRLTFLVNSTGSIYQKDLGPNTQTIVNAMTLFDPDTSWETSD